MTASARQTHEKSAYVCLMSGKGGGRMTTASHFLLVNEFGQYVIKDRLAV